MQPGLGRGAGLTAYSVVMEELQQLARFPVVPGTLSVRVPQPLERGPSWRYLSAADLTPDWEARTGRVGYFLAPVMVAGRCCGPVLQAVEPVEGGLPAT